MNLYQLPRPSLGRLAQIREHSAEVAQELLYLAESANGLITELESDHRCKVSLRATQTISHLTYTTLVWARPPSWPGGDDVTGYDTGLLSEDGTTFTPTKPGLYQILVSLGWATEPGLLTLTYLYGYLEGYPLGGLSYGLAEKREFCDQQTIQLSVVLPYVRPKTLPNGTTAIMAGNWSVVVVQSNTGSNPVDIVNDSRTWAQVVRLR